MDAPTQTASAEPGSPLPPAGWYPPNHVALTAWLQDAWANPADAPRVAVFDWDNTCIFGDVEETLFRHQLDTLALRIPPDELPRLVPQAVNGVHRLEGGVRLADLQRDVTAAYGLLWPMMRRGELDAALRLPAHRDFRAKVAWLYDALAATPGIGERYAYTWVAGWLAGLTPEEVRRASAAAIAQAVRDPIERRVWRAESDGAAGRLEYQFVHGLRPHAEMRALMAAMRRAGIEVFVVSASPEIVVETAARELGYPVDAAHVYGLRVREQGGKLGATLLDVAEYPVTYRAGKAELIRRFLPAAPLFVAGDSDTDYEMLTGFPSMQFRLIIHRNKRGDIGRLYEQASDDAGQRAGPRTLLQGRDERTGAFQPTRDTPLPGRAASTPLR